MQHPAGLHVLAQRADAVTQFSPRVASNRPPDDLSIVRFFEPVPGQADLLGHVLGAHPAIRAAIARAVGSGEATLASQTGGPDLKARLPNC